MLVTNPAARASLTEVLAHPWMVRGFTGPPETHLLHREPLRADELDRQVIQGMKGFEFGSDNDAEAKLIAVLESEAYIRAVQHWERKRNIGGNLNGHGHKSFSNSSLAISYDSKDPATPSKQKSKRFSGFDFYRRKLFSPSSSPPNSPLSNSPPTSQSHLSHSSLLDPSREPPDPTKGFHPLISMYYLAREKMERDLVYGPGQFANSQLSILDPAQAALVAASHATHHKTPANVPEDVPPAYTKAPTPAVPISINNKKESQPTAGAKADYSMALPRLPAPETSHYSGLSYDTNTATPSPTSASFHPQPRARDPGLPPPSPSAQRRTQQQQSNDVDSQQQASATVGSATVGGLPRAPPASTHRRSHSLSQRPTVLRGWGGMFGGGAGEVLEENAIPEPPRTVGPEMVTFAEKIEESKERDHRDEERDHTPSSPLSTGATLVRKFGSLLVGRGDESRRNGHGGKRGTILSGMSSLSPKASRESHREKRSGEVQEAESKEETEGATSPMQSPKSVTHSQSQPLGNSHRRAATILDPQGARRHERRSSTGAALLSGATGGTIGRHRRPSTGYSGMSRPLADRLFSRTEEEGEMSEKREDEADKPNGANGNVSSADEDDDRHGNGKEIKPIFLKGLFRSVFPEHRGSSDANTNISFCSVATTSTKPPPVIKADIKRVLDRMQVQYKESKGGFECIHLPSIDLSSVEPTSHHQQISTSGSADVSHRPSLVKKASKLSFGMRRERGKEREASVDKEREAPGRPSVGTTLTATPSSGSSSFFNVSSNHTVVAPESHPVNGVPPTPAVDIDVTPPSPLRSQSPSASVKSKVLPPIPRDFGAPSPSPRSPSPMPTGEVDPDVFESMGNNSLSVRFEINIVKVSFRLSPPNSLSLTWPFARFPFYPYTVYNSAGLVGMVGNIKCWQGES